MMKLYVVQSVVGGPIKIGCSEYPKRRINDLNTSSPFPLLLISTIDFEVEYGQPDMLVHQALDKSARIHREWYWPTEQVLSVLREFGFPNDDLEKITKEATLSITYDDEFVSVMRDAAVSDPIRGPFLDPYAKQENRRWEIRVCSGFDKIGKRKWRSVFAHSREHVTLRAQQKYPDLQWS